MDEQGVDAYLSRIGATRPAQPDPDALGELQWRHLHTVPFENLSIHLGEPITLDEKALDDKIVHRRRGGFCYELNGTFAGLLRALGFQVTLLAARAHTPVGLGPPFDHLVLRVDTPEPRIVDVGFGRFAHYPLRLDARADQPDPDGRYRVEDAADGDVDVLRDGEPQYRVELRPRELSDFVPTCWWHTTSPASHFTRSPVCSMLTGSGRVTLSDRTVVFTEGHVRREQVLDSDADVLDAYRTHFGIELERPPTPRVVRRP